MIFDSIQNKKNYKSFPLLYQALTYLEKITESNIPESGTVLVKNQLFCNPVSLTSKPENECIYESHKKYIDLHYIVTGEEVIATSDVTSLTVTQAYDPEKDIQFLEGKEDGRYCLHPGQFMVCFPSDAHKVAIAAEYPASIKKIVFKILVENK